MAAPRAPWRATRTARPSALTAPQPWMPPPSVQPRRGPPIVEAMDLLSIPAFYAAARALAGAVANLPLTDHRGEPIDRNPATGRHLLSAPTAHDTCYTFLESLVMVVHGNCFIVPTATTMRPGRESGRITQMAIIHPDHVVPRWARAGPGASWEVTITLDGDHLGVGEFIHMRDLSLGGYGFGVSRLKVLARAIGLQISEQAHVAATYDDGAQPTGYWSPGRPLDAAVAQEHAEALTAVAAGRGSGIGMVPHGVEWRQIALSHADIQLLEARQWSTATAASIIGVPPHLIGAATFDSETYSNVRSDMALFAELTLARYAAIISETLGRHGIVVQFGRSELAMPPMSERVAAMAQAVQAGLCSAAQAADMLGWDPPDTAALDAAADDEALQVAAAGDTSRPRLEAVT